MGIFNEFFKKEKPVFTGLKFGFGSGGGGGELGPFSASGGSKLAAPDGNTYHVFTHPNSDSFVVSGQPKQIQFVVVGGGGGGGWDVGGGGGGGGVVHDHPTSTWEVDAGTYTVTVGGGGAGGLNPGSDDTLKMGQNGGPSTFVHPRGTILALGGGGGGAWDNDQPAVNRGQTGGANGGGHAGWETQGSGQPGVQPNLSPIPGLSVHGGYTGGGNPSPGTSSGGGGGAGAGANGGNGGPPNVSGTAGSGATTPFACTPSTYAPLLPAASVTVIGSPGNFGPGGAGQGADSGSPGGAVAPGTGAGAKGAGDPNAGEAGGHGIVIIKYTT